MEKSREALASARAEETSKRYVFAVNRAYYACFYAASAVLLLQGEKFVKHSGVRSALHKKLVKTGRLELQWGRFYDRVFENRQRGDYQELVVFDSEQVADIIENATAFVARMQQLISI